MVHPALYTGEPDISRLDGRPGCVAEPGRGTGSIPNFGRTNEFTSIVPTITDASCVDRRPASTASSCCSMESSIAGECAGSSTISNNRGYSSAMVANCTRMSAGESPRATAARTSVTICRADRDRCASRIEASISAASSGFCMAWANLALTDDIML